MVKRSFKEVLQIRASICLVDPEKLKDSRYTTHENFIDQIALSDVLVANKMDIADSDAINLFHLWANNSSPRKALVAQTRHGQLDVSWLDKSRNPHRHALFPNAHNITQLIPMDKTSQALNNKADGYQSFGHIFPAESCFDFQQLNSLIGHLKIKRIKGILNFNKGWFIINGVGTNIQYIPLNPSEKSQIEIIATQHDFQATLEKMMQCKV